MILSIGLDILQAAALVGLLLTAFQTRDRLDKIAQLLEKK